MPKYAAFDASSPVSRIEPALAANRKLSNSLLCLCPLLPSKQLVVYTILSDIEDMCYYEDYHC